MFNVASKISKSIAANRVLTHCGLVMSYAVKSHTQHWFIECSLKILSQSLNRLRCIINKVLNYSRKVNITGNPLESNHYSAFEKETFQIKATTPGNNELNRWHHYEQWCFFPRSSVDQKLLTVVPAFTSPTFKAHVKVLNKNKTYRKSIVFNRYHTIFVCIDNEMFGGIAYRYYNRNGHMHLHAIRQSDYISDHGFRWIQHSYIEYGKNNHNRL